MPFLVSFAIDYKVFTKKNKTMSYKVIFKLLGAVIILLSITSCSSVKVHSDVDGSADFTSS